MKLRCQSRSVACWWFALSLAPGAILWGANAVNGVINIITKPAKETQGGLATAGGGDKERGFGAFRYGGTLGPKAHYRAYTKYFRRETDWERLGWRPTRILDFSEGLDDLLQSRHTEFLSSESNRPTQVGRSIYGMGTWRF